MDQFIDALDLLDLITQPAFLVRNGVIVKTNPAAAAYGLIKDISIGSLLETGAEEYKDFHSGSLFLNLNVEGVILGASVTRAEDCDIFCVEQDADNRELQAMALASRELRKSMNSVMATAQKLFPLSAIDDDPATAGQVARLNRGLFQILRVIDNMSDAERFTNADTSRQQLCNVSALIDEIFGKATALVEHTGISLEYEGYPEAVCMLADAEKLERAILNIISNAIKFTPSNGFIRAKLTRRGKKLYLTVEDSGSGIGNTLRSSLFSRYTRPLEAEDGRFGIGLGMVVIRAAAALHGGTVLVDGNVNSGTRIIMSLAIRTDSDTQLRSPRKNVDFSGGRDLALSALSETLPAELYAVKKE